MEDRVFAGLTEKEWATMEYEERYDPDGTYRGLVMGMPGRFIRECLLPLGDAGVVVGTAIWSLAFSEKGQPLSCRDIRLLACRLGTWEQIDYDATLAVLEDAGLIHRTEDEAVPLFYEDERAARQNWRKERDPGRKTDYVLAPSFAVPDWTAYVEKFVARPAVEVGVNDDAGAPHS